MPEEDYTPSILADKKEEKLSWADIQLHAQIQIFNARINRDTERFRSGVNALELLISGHKDDDYYKDLMIAETRRNSAEVADGNDTADTVFFDLKLEALSRLMYRINRGIQRTHNRWVDSPLSKEIAHKLINGIGQNAFITGSPGSGKSLTAIAFAQEVCKHTGAPFDIKTNVVFTPQQFLAVYNNEKKTPPGSCIIYDEAGVTYSSKDTYDEEVKLFSKLLQTIRHRSVFIIFTAPDLGFIAKDGRKLLHYWFEMHKMNKKQKTVTLKPFTVIISQRDGKLLYPYPIFDGKQLVSLDVMKISDKDEALYDRLATHYKNQLALETDIKYQMMEDTKVKQLKRFARLREQGKNIKEACEELKISQGTGTKLERLRKTTRVSQLSHDL